MSKLYIIHGDNSIEQTFAPSVSIEDIKAAVVESLIEEDYLIIEADNGTTLIPYHVLRECIFTFKED